jgi:hypothetical protein
VQFDIADYYVEAFGATALSGFEHGVALADSGVGAKKYGQPTAQRTRRRGLHLGEELIRIGPAIVHLGRD